MELLQRGPFVGVWRLGQHRQVLAGRAGQDHHRKAGCQAEGGCAGDKHISGILKGWWLWRENALLYEADLFTSDLHMSSNMLQYPLVDMFTILT